jgi:signal transduction histidine kinase
LLEISRVEAGVVEVGHDPYEIAAVLASAQRTVLPQAQKKGLRLQVHVDAGLPSMLGDPGKVAQCLINLLTNAVKFTPPGGEIRVRADLFDGERRYTGDDGRFGRPRERFVRVVVADTGIGIPADKVNRVFQAFYQVDNSFTREYGGTGLGLAIVKSFVEAHGGEVWVDSVEGQGTTFSLLLPVVHDRGGPAAIPS